MTNEEDSNTLVWTEQNLVGTGLEQNDRSPDKWSYPSAQCSQ